jgi:hypothetical protein
MTPKEFAPMVKEALEAIKVPHETNVVSWGAIEEKGEVKVYVYLFDGTCLSLTIRQDK